MINEMYYIPSKQPQRSKLVRKVSRKVLKTNSNCIDRMDCSDTLTCFSQKFNEDLSQTNVDSIQQISIISKNRNHQDLSKRCKTSRQNQHDINNVVSQEWKQKILQFSKQKQVLYRQKRRYRDQSINKTIQIRQISQQKEELDQINKNLIEKNKRLQKEKEELVNNLKVVQDQLSKTNNTYLNYSNIIESQSIPASSIIINETTTRQQPQLNPFSKLKSMKKFGNKPNLKTQINKICQNKSIKNQKQVQNQKINQQKNYKIQFTYKNKPRINFQQKYYQKQKQLFYAKQQINQLKIQVDCLKRKSISDLDKQKKHKSLQYIQLKHKFTKLLSQHTQLLKSIKKKQITQKIQQARTKQIKYKQTNKVNIESNSDLLSILTLSSDQSLI